MFDSQRYTKKPLSDRRFSYIIKSLKQNDAIVTFVEKAQLKIISFRTRKTWISNSFSQNFYWYPSESDMPLINGGSL